MSGDDDYEIPETGAVFTFGRSRFAENLSSHFFVRNDPVLEISCGDDHTALVCKSGRVFLFGRNDYGQLGFGHNKSVNKPSCLKYLKPFQSTHVACGKGHTVISTACNRIFTFGCNSDGQLGTGDLTDRTVPQMLRINLSEEDNICAVSAGCHHSALLTEKGDLYMWGSNSDGQCGVDGDSYLATPRKIEFEQPINSLSCGYYHTAFASLGCVYTFGEEDNGKLGRLRKSSHSDPERVEMEETCISVKCGGSHTLVLTEGGTVYAFGSNFSGQLGVQSLEPECSKPTKVDFPNGDPKIIHVSCGESHSAFVTENGFLYTCGDSRYGKLCNEDDSANQMTPTLIRNLENCFCTFVSCGGCHTMVLAKVRTPNDSGSFVQQTQEEPLPPLKTQQDFAMNINPAEETKLLIEEKYEENYEEKKEKTPEDVEGCDSKSNTESNLINYEINSQLDEIYTEIEEVITEKNEEQLNADINSKHPHEQSEPDNDLVMVRKENPIKKLLKVFKRKTTASAIVLNDEAQPKENDDSKTGNQSSSKACIVL